MAVHRVHQRTIALYSAARPECAMSLSLTRLPQILVVSTITACIFVALRRSSKQLPF
jgi:hypothetical protein